MDPLVKPEDDELEGAEDDEFVESGSTDGVEQPTLLFSFFINFCTSSQLTFSTGQSLPQFL